MTEAQNLLLEVRDQIRIMAARYRGLDARNRPEAIFTEIMDGIDTALTRAVERGARGAQST